jgi:hypothetical protein
MAASSEQQEDVPTDSLAAERISQERAQREKDLQRMLQERDEDDSLMESSNLMQPQQQRHSSYTDEAKQLISESTAQTRSKWRNSEVTLPTNPPATGASFSKTAATASSTDHSGKQMYAEQSYKEWVKEQAPEAAAASAGSADFYVPSTTPIGTGLKVVALYDYDAEDDTELSLRIDQFVDNVEKIDPGWWRGVAPNGATGLFPANYVKEV